MSVFRNAIANNYFASSRVWIQDKRLKNASRGLLGFLLSMPPHWIFNQEWMKNNLVDGKEAIRTQLKELVKFGYIIRRGQRKDENGKYSSESDWDVYDCPQIDTPLSDELVDRIFSKDESWKDEIKEMFPKAGFQTSAVQTSANPPLEIKQDKKEIKTATEQLDPPTPQRGAAAVFSCLLNLEMPSSDKEYITKTFLEPVVERSVSWATHPTTTINKSLAAAIKWACENKPEIPKSKDEKTHENKSYAKKRENAYKTINGSIVKLEALESYVHIYPNLGNTEGVEISYDLAHDEFKRQVVTAMEKYGLMISKKQ